MVGEEMRPLEVQHLAQATDAGRQAVERTQEQVHRPADAQVFAQGRAECRRQRLLGDPEEVAGQAFGRRLVGVTEKLGADRICRSASLD